MTDRIERELLVRASPEDVWDAITAPGWLAEEVRLDLHPGGDARFRSGEIVKTGWVEAALRPRQLVFWWGADGEPASRVQLTLRPAPRAGPTTPAAPVTRLTVVECRSLEVLDLVGLPLPGAAGASFGPALVAA